MNNLLKYQYQVTILTIAGITSIRHNYPISGNFLVTSSAITRERSNQWQLCTMIQWELAQVIASPWTKTNIGPGIINTIAWSTRPTKCMTMTTISRWSRLSVRGWKHNFRLHTLCFVAPSCDNHFWIYSITLLTILANYMRIGGLIAKREDRCFVTRDDLCGWKLVWLLIWVSPQLSIMRNCLPNWEKIVREIRTITILKFICPNLVRNQLKVNKLFKNKCASASTSEYENEDNFKPYDILITLGVRMKNRIKGLINEFRFFESDKIRGPAKV